MPAEERLTEQPSRDEQLKRHQVDIDLEHIMRLPQGRRTMLWVLERCAITSTAFNGSDTEITAFRLGEQNVGLWLIAQLERLGPTEYPKLLLEAAQRREETKEGVRVLDADAE